MTDSVKTRLKSIAAPYGREVRLDDVAYPSGMRLLRITIREGARYTGLEIDAATRARLGGGNASPGPTRARPDLTVPARPLIEPPPWART